MTHLHKPVARRIHLAPRGGRGNAIDVVVTLYPGGVIGLRDKGRRREYTLPLTTVYYLAAEAEAKRIMAERKAKRKERTP
jgi:hypothetical protein